MDKTNEKSWNGKQGDTNPIIQISKRNDNDTLKKNIFGFNLILNSTQFNFANTLIALSVSTYSLELKYIAEITLSILNPEKSTLLSLVSCDLKLAI